MGVGLSIGTETNSDDAYNTCWIRWRNRPYILCAWGMQVDSYNLGGNSRFAYEKTFAVTFPVDQLIVVL